MSNYYDVFAAKALGIPEEEVTDEQRQLAKAISYLHRYDASEEDLEEARQRLLDTLVKS